MRGTGRVSCGIPLRNSPVRVRVRDRIGQVDQHVAEFRAGEVLVQEHALQHEPAVAGHVGEELAVAQLVVVGQQTQQRGARHVG